jgi:hypothetical protein
MAGSCDHDIELLTSIKDGEFLDLLSDYQILMRVYAPWS